YVLISAVNEVSLNPLFSIAPNPSDGNFTIQFSNSWLGELQIGITNSLGQQIFSSSEKEVNQNFSRTIGLSVFPSGVYFLEISEWIPSGKSQGKFFREKIVIAH